MKHIKAPPIQWIPAFEAAARMLSFKKAAELLHVTPPAVSQQIKVLEDYLEKPLFDRGGRQLSLTVAGEYYYQVAKRVIKSHNQGFLEFDRRFKNRSLQVSTPLFIAQELLIPNYLSFRDQVPQSELRITTGTEYVNFDSELIDAAIRFGDGQWPDLDCRLLCQVDVSLVCNSAYFEKSGFKVGEYWSLDDLKNQVLISTYEDLFDWSLLLPELEPKDKIICDSYFSVVKSAEEGLGVAFGILPAINRWINDGRLVLPMNQTFNRQSGYWMVSPKRHEQSDIIDGFYNWAKELFEKLPPLNSSFSTINTPHSPKLTR